MKLLDVVALTEDIPVKRLSRGQVGTIVEILEAGIYEVEFSDLEGKTYASIAIAESVLMPLLHQQAA